ncbi:hypothetical protein RD792_014247 [Penstemon davidsonii]|uniref:F-box domain-containing protein n=1 Tax=Penstemon davidsonii TaxID=160366 RepID=A0ABR0CNX7_9LAMI|nr:hypothetical protein RD792_014247 [Penstemon davidsonii]
MAGEGRKRMRPLPERSNVRDSRTQPLQQQTESELPPEILEDIISRVELEDNIRASAVCKSWLAAAISVRVSNKPPWLMVFPRSGKLYKFYDPSQRKTYWLELPELDEAKVCHAKDGWLLLSKPRLRKIFFFCPYTQELIKLPDIEFSYERVKIAFSTSPKSTSCVVFSVRLVSPNIVALSNWCPGATEWSTVFYTNPVEFHRSLCSNLVFCNGRFYYFCITGWVGVYRPDFNTWTVYVIHTPCPGAFFDQNWCTKKFVVEHDGEIFLILTSSDLNPVVYQLNQVNLVWMERKSLGGMSLFASLLSSHARVDLLGKMRDSVYFPKVRFHGKRCVSYSITEGRYYPRNQIYDWGEIDPLESLWIDQPEDLPAFLQK